MHHLSASAVVSVADFPTVVMRMVACDGSVTDSTRTISDGASVCRAWAIWAGTSPVVASRPIWVRAVKAPPLLETALSS